MLSEEFPFLISKWKFQDKEIEKATFLNCNARGMILPHTCAVSALAGIPIGLSRPFAIRQSVQQTIMKTEDGWLQTCQYTQTMGRGGNTGPFKLYGNFSLQRLPYVFCKKTL